GGLVPFSRLFHDVLLPLVVPANGETGCPGLEFLPRLVGTDILVRTVPRLPPARRFMETSGPGAGPDARGARRWGVPLATCSFPRIQRSAPVRSRGTPRFLRHRHTKHPKTPSGPASQSLFPHSLWRGDVSGDRQVVRRGWPAPPPGSFPAGCG